VLRIATQHEADATAAEAALDVRQALDQEGVVAKVRALDERVQAEEGHDRFLKAVPNLDGNIERGIIGGALRTLHPVDDTGAVAVRLAASSNRDPRVRSRHVSDRSADHHT
jgi:hypothetical protein